MFKANLSQIFSFKTNHLEVSFGMLNFTNGNGVSQTTCIGMSQTDVVS